MTIEARLHAAIVTAAFVFLTCLVIGLI